MSLTATHRANALALHHPPERRDGEPRWKQFAEDVRQHNPARTWEGIPGKARDHAATVYEALGQHVNCWAQCWPSVRGLAARTGLDPRQIRRSLAHLERVGLIVRIERGGPGGRGRGRNTTYWLPDFARYLVHYGTFGDGSNPVPAVIRNRPHKATSSGDPGIVPIKRPESSSESYGLNLKEESYGARTSKRAAITAREDKTGAERTRPRSTPRTSRPAAAKEFSNAKTLDVEEQRRAGLIVDEIGRMLAEKLDRTPKTPATVPDLTWERRRRLELRREWPDLSPGIVAAQIRLERQRALQGVPS